MKSHEEKCGSALACGYLDCKTVVFLSKSLGAKRRKRGFARALRACEAKKALFLASKTVRIRMTNANTATVLQRSAYHANRQVI